ncbi:MAG: FixH family protein [Dehalococcoidia bacterium]|nr:FixH family protein [Dehalococcoidia bacterium]
MAARERLSRTANATLREMGRAGLVVAGLLLLAAVLACGGGGVTAPTGNDPSPSKGAAEEQRLWIKHGEDVQPFKNGDEVSAGGMNAEIFVSPYPPGRSANIDFYLTRGGEPIENANVSLQYDMTVMEHGPFELLAVPTGRGHYLAALDFVMNGDFWLNVSLDIANDESIINLLVRAAR